MAPLGKTMVSLGFLEGPLCHTTVEPVGTLAAAAKSYGWLGTIIKPKENSGSPPRVPEMGADARVCTRESTRGTPWENVGFP